MMKKRLLMLVLSLAVVWFCSVEAKANLITNGSFEIGPSGGFSWYATGSTGLTGWTVLGTPGASNSVEALSNAFFWSASDGTYSLDLNGTSPGGVEQTFSTEIGSKYHVSFDMAGNTAHTNYTMRVAAAGKSQDYFYNKIGATWAWDKLTFEFTANSTSTTLSFMDVSDPSLVGGGAAGPALDNVDVSKTATAVPGPSTLVLIVTGLAAVVGMKKHSRTYEMVFGERRCF